jgi:hypothetical protein
LLDEWITHNIGCAIARLSSRRTLKEIIFRLFHAHMLEFARRQRIVNKQKSPGKNSPSWERDPQTADRDSGWRDRSDAKCARVNRIVQRHQIHDHSRRRGHRAAHQHLDKIIVPVAVRVVALSVRRAILLGVSASVCSLWLALTM